jgi:hypothetical protein
MTHKHERAADAVDCPECCCILNICCDPAAAKQAYIDKAVKDIGCTPEMAAMHYEWTTKHFALAPKSFQQVITDIVTMSREHKG